MRHEIQQRSGGVPSNGPSASFSATAEARRAVVEDRDTGDDGSSCSGSDFEDSGGEDDPALAAWRRQRLTELQQQATASGNRCAAPSAGP